MTAAMLDDVSGGQPIALKLTQAFVKLRGDGLAYDMGRVEFRFAEAPVGGAAAMHIDGERLSRCGMR